MWRLKILIKIVPVQEKDSNLSCCLSSALVIWYLKLWRETCFLLKKKEYIEEGQKREKIQVSFYLVHYWITAAESYSQYYLELDSRRFAYSASGCHMGVSAFIFLSPYCLNKDPHCFLFSKPHPQSNKLFHWREKNTPRQGNTTHLPTEECEEGKNVITELNMPRSQTVLMHNPVLHLTGSGAGTAFSSCWASHSGTWFGPLWLSLISSPLQQNLLRMWEVQNSNY